MDKDQRHNAQQNTQSSNFENSSDKETMSCPLDVLPSLPSLTAIEFMCSHDVNFKSSIDSYVTWEDGTHRENLLDFIFS